MSDATAIITGAITGAVIAAALAAGYAWGWQRCADHYSAIIDRIRADNKAEAARRFLRGAK